MIDPREFARRLASGATGNEHSPFEAARIIEQLLREVDELSARNAELEKIVGSEKTKGYLRDAYARGFRACQRQIAARVPPGSAAEQEILGEQPNFEEASKVAQAVAA